MKHFNLIKNIAVRYLLIFLLSLGNLSLFYLIFTPLTLYPSYFVLKLLYGASLVYPNIIKFQSFTAELIPACIAGAAYFLLVALNLTTPMNKKTRIKSLAFIILSFLLLNMIRIILFAYLAISGFQSFDLVHKLTWYFGSTILVVIIWLVNVYMFKIKSIPVYSDAREIIKSIEKNKRTK